MKKKAIFALAALAGTTMALPQAATAQVSDEWRFNAVLYGYFPSIGGKSTFPPRDGGSNIDVDASKIISALKFTFMGTFEAQKGRWGFLTDILYMDLGGSKSATRDITIGHVTLPAGVTANANLDIKGTVWELAGTYLAVSDPGVTVNLLAGGIVGVKGRFAFGENREWFVPYYVDVGTGDSDVTWQIIGGIGYAFKWGDVIAGWRYLDYNFKSGGVFEDANFNGPIVGVAFHW